MKSSELYSNKKEYFIKIFLMLLVFLCTFFVFKLLQKPAIYHATLGKIARTYNGDGDGVIEVNESFYYPDARNLSRWDGRIYIDIKKNYYNSGDCKYAFFPLFPLLWRLLSISTLYIGIVNYLLFGFSIILISGIFLDTSRISVLERLCVFITALILPPIVVYYLPYADASFTFTFALAMFGLIKNKYWLFFIGILLFATSRPVFLIVGLSFVMLDFIYFLQHRNISHFIKELSLKLLPLMLGTFIVFFMFYLNSGSFFKYFSVVNKYWNAGFSIPQHISDWSVEGFGMTVFTIVFILFSSLILFLTYFFKTILLPDTKKLQSIFNGNVDFMKEYFFYNSIIYFWGVFVFVVFYQDGCLNGLSRYIIASPQFFIFYFYFYTKLRKFEITKFIIGFVLLFSVSLILLTSQVKLSPQLNFNDSGFFLLAAILIYLFALRFMNNYLKIILLILLVFSNMVWIAYLYNIYLCNGFIYT